MDHSVDPAAFLLAGAHSPHQVGEAFIPGLVAVDEPLVGHIRLEREIRAAVLRVAARVGLEQLPVDPADRLEQRRRRRERRWGGEVEDDVVGGKIEARGVVRVEEERAPLRHHVPQAVGQHLDVGLARRVRAPVHDGVDVRWVGLAHEATRPDLEAGVQATKGEPMTIKIAANGTPKPDVVWIRGNDELVPSDRIQVTAPTTEGDDTYTLTILNVQPEDQGDYSAKITNVGGQLKSKKCKVTVSSKFILLSFFKYIEIVIRITCICC